MRQKLFNPRRRFAIDIRQVLASLIAVCCILQTNAGLLHSLEKGGSVDRARNLQNVLQEGSWSTLSFESAESLAVPNNLQSPDLRSSRDVRSHDDGRCLQCQTYAFSRAAAPVLRFELPKIIPPDAPFVPRETEISERFIAFDFPARGPPSRIG